MARDDRRTESRRPILLNVRCRIAAGLSPEVWLTNLSDTGCQLILRAGVLMVDQHIVIEPRELEGVPGLVKWTAETRAGIAFDIPLDQAMIDCLLATKPTAASPPERGRDEFVDRFGRPLPEWPRSRNSGGGRRDC